MAIQKDAKELNGINYSKKSAGRKKYINATL